MTAWASDGRHGRGEPEDPVRQFVLRWDADHPSGGTGFGVVAASGRWRDAEAIARSVGPTLEVAGENAVPGLVRLRNRDSVLLAHRTPGRDAGGRSGTVCHVLVGTVRQLSVRRCLALHAWTWEPEPLTVTTVRGDLLSVAAESLAKAESGGLAALRAELAHPDVAATLTALTAEVLRDPDRRFSVLDPSLGRAPHAVLAGLNDMFGPVLADQQRGWSFATHDTDDSKPLRFVFLREWPPHPSSEPRARVDPRRGRKDTAAGLAKELVERLLEGVDPAHLQDVLQRHANRETPHRPGWLPRATSQALDRLSSPPRLPTRTGDQEPPTPQPSAPQPWDPAPRAPFAEADELLDELRDVDVRGPRLGELLARIDERGEHWDEGRQFKLCLVLLERDLFLGAPPDGTEERVVDAYERWVRPFSHKSEVVNRLKTIVSTTWSSSRDNPRAREALTRIVEGGPGFAEQVWIALWRATRDQAAAHRPAPPAHEPAPGPAPGPAPETWAPLKDIPPAPGYPAPSSSPPPVAEPPRANPQAPLWDSGAGPEPSAGPSGRGWTERDRLIVVACLFVFTVVVLIVLVTLLV
ncbi:hypothetical protein [Streptomyces sedi]|uniref:Uncharacterized protein n=1 Tax=Streptomyces sedi TaxID=555059 RepID=A0A5C4V5E9_9ACTN|nr:hypothetical protein [Streptomyces sedi]TNM30309.1 hypothetical protein FH715_13270 [Streptomyces sedi]